MVPAGFLNHQRDSCGRTAKKATRHSQQILDQREKIKRLFQACSKHFYTDQKTHLVNVAGEGSNDQRPEGMMFTASETSQNRMGYLNLDNIIRNCCFILFYYFSLDSLVTKFVS